MNHFQKKFKTFWYIIDSDNYNKVLIFRLLETRPSGQTKCLKKIDVYNWISLHQLSFIGTFKDIESQFSNLSDS